ncbi:MAG: substrate-binding domain-containing protein [Clostridia bacterium]|nr:substrate-binding domain-containing protein [Clostridia bacterium]
MRKIIGYIPVIFFGLLYIFAGFSQVMSIGYIWLLMFIISGMLLHKGLFWGGAPGIIPTIHLIYMGVADHPYRFYGTSNVNLIAGIAIIIFYCVYGIYLWKNKDKISVSNREIAFTLLKIVLTFIAIFISVYLGIVLLLGLSSEGYNDILVGVSAFVFPSFAIPLIWLRKRKKFIIVWLILALLLGIGFGVNYGIMKYEESITINTSPNIDVSEYLPFDENSKIVKLESDTKFTDPLPKIDGAAALFPVYSAFVNSTYPSSTQLGDGVFSYNNTPIGYELLAQKDTDMFIGVYPSKEQIAYAEENDTTFIYTPIGSEAFVFFVHKDNPIESLSTEQIKGIYSGEITNWSQVGGLDEKIVAFQRNEGSGSQSMLKRFMGDTPIMEAPKDQVNDLMAGIIERVSNYKNKTNSIGFSFRFYVEGIIKNPDIKMIAIDGVAPTAKNIKNGTYPVVTPIYAVTYEGNANENVNKLLDWILSDDGQRIIEETGYVATNQIRKRQS